MDARYETVREGGVIVSRAVLIAVAVDSEGRRQGGPGEARRPVELTRVLADFQRPRLARVGARELRVGHTPDGPACRRQAVRCAADQKHNHFCFFGGQPTYRERASSGNT
ncbi:MAG: transposase [Dongiaceae bacterium]